jgi:hypothetical protein
MPYTIEINGYRVQCDTPEELLKLTGVRGNVAPITAPKSKGKRAPATQVNRQASPNVAIASPAIRLLVEVGEGGIDAAELATKLNLKSSKGLGPVNLQVNNALARIPNSNGPLKVIRRKTPTGKKWYLPDEALRYYREAK